MFYKEAIPRCQWVDIRDALYISYHDQEWGIPVHQDNRLFEALALEMFAAGLSWKHILHKRSAFREAFDNFDVIKISQYDDKKIISLLKNNTIIRHKGKITACIHNAQVFLKIQSEWGSFNHYLWHWTNDKSIFSDGLETTSLLSDIISHDLKKQGMKFVGSITIFAYLCAIGIIQAHQDTCFMKQKQI